MKYSFFKLSLLFLFVFIPLLLFALYASAQEDRSIKFGDFYPPTITNTPPPTKTPTPTLGEKTENQAPPEENQPENDRLPLPSSPNSPRLPTPAPPSKCVEMISSGKQIIDSLARGFWQYYNYSSLYDRFFDEELYKETGGNVCIGSDEYGDPYPPNCTGTRPHAFQLFWCTWLPMKTYERFGLSMPQNLYSVVKMRDWFMLQGRHLPGATPWQNIPIGSAIFFGHKTGAHHVALVTAKNRNYITIYESNNYVRSRKLTVGRNGTVQGGNNDTILGFGTPPTRCEQNTYGNRK